MEIAVARTSYEVLCKVVLLTARHMKHKPLNLRATTAHSEACQSAEFVVAARPTDCGPEIYRRRNAYAIGTCEHFSADAIIKCQISVIGANRRTPEERRLQNASAPAICQK